MEKNRGLEFNFEQESKKDTSSDKLEIGDVVPRDTPLRGHRPSVDDLIDPTEIKKKIL